MAGDFISNDQRQTKRFFGVRRVLELLAPFIALFLIVVLFSVLAPDRFISAYNFKTVATQTVIVGLGAIGMTFVIVSGGIDLSVGSVIALSSVITALILRAGEPASVAVSGGVLAGGVLGFANGWIITRLRIVPFIVTLGTMGIARGLAKYLADEQKVDAPAIGLSAIMAKTPDPDWLLFAPGVWLMLALALAMGLVLKRTTLGTYAFAIGSNEATAYLCGIRVERVKLAIYALCGLFAGLSGTLQFCRLTVGDPTTALGKELDVIAAVVIGGGSLAGGSGGILGSMVGAFLMSFLSNGCTLTGVPNYVQEIIIGAIIIIAVAVDSLRHRHQAGPPG
ncbi:MAG: ABC transporter permease [Deltaproteobacteria bacterium]|nr:ABC transporter permease [Deltaproteobacteria bacterium]